MKHPTILLVDDDGLVIRAVARILAPLGTVIEIHPRDAEAYLRETPPDVAIFDYSGHPVQKWIALASPSPSIVFTGHVPTPTVPDAFEVVAKPARPRTLREAVARALRARLTAPDPEQG